MPPISTAERIVAAAVSHFADHGYDASSLAQIAEAVGIRKASLYSHFTGKDEIFLRAFSEALETECQLARSCFANEPGNALPGLNYCNSLIKRFAASEQLQFLLRTGYMPPVALAEQINAGHEAYLAQLLDDFVQVLGVWAGSRWQLSQTEIDLYAEAYLGVVDSLQVKLVYTDAQQAQLRLAALYRLLEDALAQRMGRGSHSHE